MDSTSIEKLEVTKPDFCNIALEKEHRESLTAEKHKAGPTLESVDDETEQTDRQ